MNYFLDSRFVLVSNGEEVNVMDTEEDNVLVFSVDCENEGEAKYLKEELFGMVALLNYFDKELKD